MTATLSDFTVSRDFNIQEVEKCLRTHGAAVLPAWLGDSELTFLRQEFDDAIADSDERYAYQIKYEPGHAVSMMRDRLPADKYRGINRIFNSKKMVELTQRYMGSQHLLNYEVYATHEHRPGVDVAPTHFDKLCQYPKAEYYRGDHHAQRVGTSHICSGRAQLPRDLHTH